jgi:hypothetical protein
VKPFKSLEELPAMGTHSIPSWLGSNLLLTGQHLRDLVKQRTGIKKKWLQQVWDAEPGILNCNQCFSH